MAYSNTVKEGTGDFLHLVSEANVGMLLVSLGWTPDLQVDEALTDSDKSFTVPASTEWRVKWIYIEYTSTAAAGTRQVEIQIQDDAADVIARLVCGDTQIASLTRYYLFAPNVTELVAERDTDKFSTLMPEWILPAAYVVRVWDNNAIAAAADGMIVQMMVEARTV